jgi:hypothetical protein
MVGIWRVEAKLICNLSMCEVEDSPSTQILVVEVNAGNGGERVCFLGGTHGADESDDVNVGVDWLRPVLRKAR